MNRLQYIFLSLMYVGVFAVTFFALSPQSTSAAMPNLPITIAEINEDDCADLKDCSLITKYVNPAIKLLAALAALAAVVGITVGGVQYSSSGGDPQKVGEGKKKVINGLVGFVAFLFLASFVQFLTPGGLEDVSGSVPSPSAATCAQGRSFMGIKPWYVYLKDDRFDKENQSCAITGFQVAPENGVSDLVPVTLAVVDGLLRIAGLVAGIFVIVGGVKYITSQGEPGDTAQAKDTIINAVIGLVIVMIAATVVNFIGTNLLT